MPVAVVLLVVLTACHAGQEAAGSGGAAVTMPQSQAGSERREVRVGESLRAGAATITFVGVRDDSRCPTGVTCVWEGDAVVDLTVRVEGAEQGVELHANPRFAQEATVLGLRIRLERLEPYPVADQPIPADGYRAVLLVETI